MKRFLLVLFFLMSSYGFCNITFKDKILKANKGDFIVTEKNNVYTLLSINDINENSITFEEVSILKDKYKYPSFRKWIEDNAPDHSSWLMYEIDLNTYEIIEVFSFSKRAWLTLSKDDAYLCKLFSLPIKKINKRDRKKIGPRPLPGEMDTRAIWNPPMTIDSKIIEKKTIEVYKAKWPKDSTEFSNNTLELYFNENDNFAFPYWIQASSNHLTIMLKAVDSGKNLKSPKQFLPKRPPIVQTITENNGNIFITLKKSTFKDFNLFALDLTKEKKIIHSIPFNFKKEKDIINLEIPKETLNNILENNHKYKWVINPQGHTNIYVESNEITLWKSENH